MTPPYTPSQRGQQNGSVSLSRVQLFATPGTVAYQAPLSMGILQARKLESVQGGIFPTQGSNMGLLHCRQFLYRPSHQGSPGKLNALLVKLHPLESPSRLPTNPVSQDTEAELGEASLLAIHKDGTPGGASLWATP